MVKYAVMALLALCALQGFGDAKSVTSEETRSLESVIDNIKAIMAKIEQFIDDLAANVQRAVDQLKQKIQDIIDSFNFKDLLDAIEKKIEEILTAAGIDVNAAKACIQNEGPAVQDLIQKIGGESQECQAAAMASAQVVIDKFQGVIEEALDDKDQLVDQITKCINDNDGNVMGVVVCLVGQVKTTYDKVNQLRLDAQAAIELAQTTGQKIQQDMTVCMAAVQVDLLKGERAIITDIKTCVMA